MLKASSHQASISEACASAGCLFDDMFEAIAPALEMLIDVDRLAHRLDEIRGELRDQSETLLCIARQVHELERRIEQAPASPAAAEWRRTLSRRRNQLHQLDELEAIFRHGLLGLDAAVAGLAAISARFAAVSNNPDDPKEMAEL